MFTGLLANTTVKDQTLAQDWYSRLFGRGPDAAPMPGLLEWHFTKAWGIQVWAEPERAGCSTNVIGESALDALSDRLTSVDIDHMGPESGGGQRILRVADPDGNRIVFAGE